jgi:two-component system, OmpR family, KDP operon response regulator KdpE
MTDQIATKPLALIVEDDKSLMDIFSRALEEAGYATEMIGDGREAIERLAVITPYLIILDLQLPSASGGDVLHYIRATEHLKGTRVILATANSQWADMLRDQADWVFDKPISFRQLRDLTARLRPTLDQKGL